MEALALLCTLHADGPATLKRLRRAGCGTLQQLEQFEPEQLANLLEIPAAVARRLLKESRHLSERMGPTGLGDGEESAEGLPDPTPEAAGTGALDGKDLALLGQVLDRWAEDSDTGERDQVESVLGEALYPALEATMDLLSRESPEPKPLPRPDDSSLAPRPAARVDGVVDGMLEGQIEGLDQDTVLALQAAGIDSLTLLQEVNAAQVATLSGIAFAQIKRLQYLARSVDVQTGSATSPRPSTVSTTTKAPQRSGETFSPTAASEIELLPTRNPMGVEASTQPMESEATRPEPAGGTALSAPGEWVESIPQPLRFSPAEDQDSYVQCFGRDLLAAQDQREDRAAESTSQASPEGLSSAGEPGPLTEAFTSCETPSDSPAAVQTATSSEEPSPFSSPFHRPLGEPASRKFWEPRPSASMPLTTSLPGPLPARTPGTASGDATGGLSWNFEQLSPTPKSPMNPGSEETVPGLGLNPPSPKPLEPERGSGGPFA